MKLIIRIQEFLLILIKNRGAATDATSSETPLKLWIWSKICKQDLPININKKRNPDWDFSFFYYLPAPVSAIVMVLFGSGKSFLSIWTTGSWTTWFRAFWTFWSNGWSVLLAFCVSKVSLMVLVSGEVSCHR